MKSTTKTNLKKIISLLEDNWISTYTIIFNENSNFIINDNKNLVKDIVYLIPKYKTIHNKNNDDTEDIREKIQFYLKAIFNKKYRSKSFDFFTIKKLISRILKFIYISKDITIFFDIHKKEK